MIEANEQWLRHPISHSELDNLVNESYCKTVKRPREKESSECFSLIKRETGWIMSSSYFVGIDWLEEGKTAVRIKPKFDHEDNQIEVNYLGMLEEALKEPKNFDQLDGLLYVDFNRPGIPVPRQDDMLSLFIISEFLHVVKRITDKGLRKSYFLLKQTKVLRLKGSCLYTRI